MKAEAVGVHSPGLGKSPVPSSCPAPFTDPRKPSQVPNRAGRATLTELGTSFVLYSFIQHQFRKRTFPWGSSDPAELPCILPDRRESQLPSPPAPHLPSLTHPLAWLVVLFLNPLSECLVLFCCAMETKMPNADFLRKCDLFFLRQPTGRASSTPRSRADTVPARELQ